MYKPEAWGWYFRASHYLMCPIMESNHLDLPVQFNVPFPQRKQSTAGKSLISLYRYNNGIGNLFREALKGLIANISAEYKTYCTVSSSWWKQLTKHSLLVEAAQTGPLLSTICSRHDPPDNFEPEMICLTLKSRITLTFQVQMSKSALILMSGRTVSWRSTNSRRHWPGRIF